MLKTLKWVYALGVNQERQRIARHLEAYASTLGGEYEMERNMLNNIPDNARRRKQQLELRQAVTNRVAKIVNSILNPQYEDRAMFSIMFPDDESKKEK